MKHSRKVGAGYEADLVDVESQVRTAEQERGQGNVNNVQPMPRTIT